MSKLNHLGIVKIYEVFEEAFNYYIILEYLEGGNLNEYIKK